MQASSHLARLCVVLTQEFTEMPSDGLGIKIFIVQVVAIVRAFVVIVISIVSLVGLQCLMRIVQPCLVKVHLVGEWGISRSFERVCMYVYVCERESERERLAASRTSTEFCCVLRVALLRAVRVCVCGWFLVVVRVVCVSRFSVRTQQIVHFETVLASSREFEFFAPK